MAEDTKTTVAQHEDAEAQQPAAKPPKSGFGLHDVWENRRVLSYCLLIFMLPVNFGYEMGMIGKLLASDSFLLRFGQQVGTTRVISATNQQILNAPNSIGIFLSAITTGFLSDAIGRRLVIVIGSVICVCGIIGQYFASDILHLFAGKLVSCFGFGLGHSLGPVYVAELAPVKLRGTCLALVNTMIVLGQWLGSATVYGASVTLVGDATWRVPIITQVIPPALLLAGSVILPESPSWLLLKGRREDAAKAYRKFNGPKFDVDKAMAILTATVMQEEELRHANKTASWIDCFKGPNGRRTLIICMVYLSQQFIGVNFIAGYLTYYFKLAGVDNALGMAQMAFAVQLLGNICSWPLIERLGRRPLIVGGMITMTGALLIIGGVSTIGTRPALSATVSLMTVWGFLYHATLGAVAYAVGGETPSPALRQKTYSINIMSATVVSCIVFQVMPYLINTDKANLGGKICFVFFGPSVFMCFYLFYCLPETKGRDYAELEEMFQARLPARKFKNHVCSNAHELSEAVQNAKTGEVETK